ncbi:spore photoproduct lyase [Sporanaerobium hydrogeniformans]|uniref:Spore photoproduct lyase n=1 Tax=Sporanaerobium hydrogeniformans TaxID=3072179 RepID=A0AC61DB66_9FIRM|nr:spore photoproduct lyase [Sporanaerobium hydrogeniformans]PHV70485.1 spore photoproduct lyase [Sporanaerobium hydrogeniformans]
MFIPKRIIFEKDVLHYPMAQAILETFKDKPHTQIIQLSSNRIKAHIPGDELATQFREGKRTLVVDTKKSLKFQSCKPSAHYQLPLVSGCMGQCEYCYLNTNLGDKPFVRVHANIDEILCQANKYIEDRLPEITLFEGAATSDPIPVEPYTHALAKAITFFGNTSHGRFRFVTKFNDVDSLVHLPHHGHTEVRFSINTDYVISAYEKGTPSRDKRLEASLKMLQAGYPLGFLIAPVFIYPHWKEDYHELLELLKVQLPQKLNFPITFEIISHRYTLIAKNRILQVFPETTLPMIEKERQFKYGQFGYGKYIYPKETMDEIKDFFIHEINNLFTHKEIKYII